MEKKTIEISTSTLLKILFIIFLIWLAWRISGIIILLAVVLIIFAALNPTVDWFEAKKIPRILSAIIIYIIGLAILAGISYLIIPPLVLQIQDLIDNAPNIISQVSSSYHFLQNFFSQQSSIITILQKPLSTASDQLAKFSINIFSTARGFFTAIGAIVTILVLVFYLLIEKNGLKNIVEPFLPIHQKTAIFTILHKVREKWGAWMRGQIILCIIIAVIDFIALFILGVPYALALAVWAGLTEIIPYLGPVLGAIPALIVAYFVSPWLALIVLIIFVIVQQLEGHILVPKIMQKAVGLSPVIIIVALLIGGVLAGILGVILAVPIMAGMYVLISEWQNLVKKSDE
ncbi:MAG TPA: AI-2E family transporter [Patescibacteria group bacterium]|nr:AI-2E family transporter [Patescibacteria group bacterium]